MKGWKRITVDAEVAHALRGLAIGEMEGVTALPDGQVAFLIDPDVASELERQRKPGEDDSRLLRRVLKDQTGILIPERRPN
jgi:hypothetical protein